MKGNQKIDTRFIKSHPLLAMIPTFTLRRLIAQAALDEYPKGTVVYHQGKPCEAIYLVLSGRCESRLLGNGADAVYGPGDALGARELLNNETYRATVTVLTHSVLLRIPAEELEKIFASKPSVAGLFSASISGRGGGRSIRQTDLLPGSRAKLRARRIVSLVSMPGRDRDVAIREDRALAGAVQTIAGGRVLMVEFVPSPEKFALTEWANVSGKCNGFNGEFCLRQWVRETDSGFSQLRVSVRGDDHEPEFVAPFLSHLGLHFDFVLLHLAADLPPPTLRECMIQSDIAYVFLRQTSRDLQDFQFLMREPESAQCSHIRPILHTEAILPPEEFSEVLKQVGRPVHAFVRDVSFNSNGQGSPVFSMHLNRLAREIGQRRVGIAFSSGGAKGFAHIGVIQVLEENGIEVDVITGSSMGAYTGAVWAHGYTGEAMERFARELEGRWGLLQLFDPVLPPREGFMRSTRVANRLRRSIGHAQFSDLIRPLRVVATDMETMERVVFSGGEVAKAVEASIAIPGICVPVEIDGETYIDGGIADPLPVDVLVEMGIERIIAVNTIPTPEQLRRYVDEGGGAEGASGGLVARFLRRHLNYFAHGNILDTMYRSTHGVQMRLAEMACKDADVVLWAIAADAKWHDFTNPGKYIALGRKVAEAHLPELKALIQGDGYEPQSKPEKPAKSVAAAA